MWYSRHYTLDEQKSTEARSELGSECLGGGGEVVVPMAHLVERALGLFEGKEGLYLAWWVFGQAGSK